MTSRVTRVSGGVTRVSWSAEGSGGRIKRVSAEGRVSGGVKRDDITSAAAAFLFRREFFWRTRTARDDSLARNDSLRRKAS